jgi:hypothetical protein
VNVTLYVPGRRSMIRYWPAPSVTAVRTFSINAGLDASTVTPGSTAPDESRTAPAIDAGVGTRGNYKQTNRQYGGKSMHHVPLFPSSRRRASM